MELIKIDLENKTIPSNIIACIGEFDGIHIAHKELIKKVLEIGKKKNLKTGIITFDPHPDYILNKKKLEKYITPVDEKIKIIEKNYEIDYLIIIHFTKELSEMSKDDFYNLYLKDLNTLVIGYDFRFGKNGEGDYQYLKSKKDNIFVFNQICFENQKVGTSMIIELLKEGDMKLVSKLLGRNYSISGVVSKGSQIGKKIGFPTANINLSDKYYSLKKGVYVCKVLIENQYYLGICNFGNNPSFNEIEKPRVEVHIFDFNDDIYDSNITIEFIDFIRKERKFESIEKFKEQLNKDISYCINKYGG